MYTCTATATFLPACVSEYIERDLLNLESNAGKIV